MHMVFLFSICQAGLVCRCCKIGSPILGDPFCPKLLSPPIWRMTFGSEFVCPRAPATLSLLQDTGASAWYVLASEAYSVQTSQRLDHTGIICRCSKIAS